MRCRSPKNSCRNKAEGPLPRLTGLCLILALLVSCGKKSEPGRSAPIAPAPKANGQAAALSTKCLSWGLVRRGGGRLPSPDPGAEMLLARHGGRWIGDTNRRRFYLTFDEGYENGLTPRILDTLRIQGVRGLFFITGAYLRDHAALVQRMVEEGHAVGNHTMTHPSLPGLDEAVQRRELGDLSADFRKRFHAGFAFMRPPKGEYSDQALALARELGYTTLFWSFAYDDWDPKKQRGEAATAALVLSNLHPGAVLLLHAVSADNAAALTPIIYESRRRGWDIGDPDELRAAEPVAYARAQK